MSAPTAETSVGSKLTKVPGPHPKSKWCEPFADFVKRFGETYDGATCTVFRDSYEKLRRRTRLELNRKSTPWDFTWLKETGQSQSGAA